MKYRNINIDAAKGIAIILVVLGHAIEHSVANPDKYFLHAFIYSFHMPLFMFLSGYVVYQPEKELNFAWLKKRFTFLVIPFVSWIFLPYVFTGNWDMKELLNKIINIINRPDCGGLWFLWILFCNCCILFAGSFIHKKINWEIKNNWIILVGLVLAVNVFSLFFQQGGNIVLGMVAWYSVFYVGGYLFAEYRLYERFIKRWILISLAVLYFLVLPMWSRTGKPFFLQEYELSGAISFIITRSFNYIVAFFGIAFIFTLILILPTIWKRGLAYLGKYTLEIYVLHMFWLPMVKISNFYLSIFVMLIVGIGGALICAKIVQKGWIGVLMFGKRVG